MRDEIAIFEHLLRMGDNTLILGQRVSEWCGHAPVLEEDIALANTALDLIGQTRLWLGLAGELEGKGRTADDLAFRRDAWEFRNLLLVELPNGDFGQTILRQFLYDAWASLILPRLAGSSDARIAEIAAKAVKENAYHLERSRHTVIALGDGNTESHARMQAALDRLWPYIGEMFSADEVDEILAEAGIAPDPASLRPNFDTLPGSAFREGNLIRPDDNFSHLGGRDGKMHSEHLGHLLATMQFLPRAYPEAQW